MYNLIRWGIAFVIVLLVIILMKRKKIKLSPIKINLILLLILCGSSALLCLLPVENLFISFKTPERAYQYMHLKSIKKDDFVLNGKDSSMVITSEKTDYFPKDKNGWKLDPFINTKRVYHKVKDKYSINIVRYGNTKDYYVTVTSYNDKKFNLTDSKKSKFYSRDTNVKTVDMKVYSYVGYVHNIDENYYLLIDDEEININIKEN